MIDENIRILLRAHNDALLALKKQRDIDRNRRLMLIRRLKKEKQALQQKLLIAGTVLFFVLLFI